LSLNLALQHARRKLKTQLPAALQPETKEHGKLPHEFV